jgi:hypothetical protein
MLVCGSYSTMFSSLLSLSTIFLLDFLTVPTERYLLMFFYDFII